MDPIYARLDALREELDAMGLVLRTKADTCTWRRLIVDNGQLLDNLTATQERCTRQEEELRQLRRELDVANLTIAKLRATERAELEQILDGEVDP